MIDRKAFFEHARAKPFGGSLTQSQVEGMDRILDEWEHRGLSDPRHLAYMLATTYHETARAMQPVREGGGEAYLQSKKYYPWVGEGLVQVTWEENHRKFGATAPGQMLTWPMALSALFDGMLTGMFTGKKLSDYFGSGKNDPVGARHIINGSDKADLIAGYHYDFLLAIGAVGALVATAPVIPSPGPVAVGPHITGVAPTSQPSLWARLVAALTGKKAA